MFFQKSTSVECHCGDMYVITDPSFECDTECANAQTGAYQYCGGLHSQAVIRTEGKVICAIIKETCPLDTYGPVLSCLSCWLAITE